MEARGKTSQQMIKDANLKLIFNLIGEEEPISRADLKKITGLSATTVSALCEELLEKNLIVETGVKKSATSGRKAILLSINPNGGYFCGVELASSLKLEVYDLNFRRIASVKEKVQNWRQVSGQIVSMLQGLSGQLAQHGQLLGLSVGAPATIDTQNRRILSSTVLDQRATEEDIVAELEAALPDIPILLCNDSSLIAYAEKEFGSHVSNLVSIDISEGVGSGIVIDGGIYAGAGGMAGEFGHVSVDLNGPKCKCGSFGCLESMVSIPAVTKRIYAATGRELTPCEVQKACQKGDKVLQDILNDTARVLSFGINNLLNLLDPEIIVLAGEIKDFGDALLLPLRQLLAEKALPGKQIPVQFSSVEGNAVTLGGARYAFDVRFQ